MSKAPPPEGYDDNPEWTDDDFARAKPANEVLLPQAAAALMQRKRGRPAGSTTSSKTQVALRLDVDVVERFKAGGAGWQTRMNDTLRQAVGLGHSISQTRSMEPYEVHYFAAKHGISPEQARGLIGDLVEFADPGQVEALKKA